MRLSNRTRQPFYRFLNTIAVLSLVGGVAAFFLERYRFDFLGAESIFLILVPAAFSGYIYLRGRSVFEYDSDGEALNFKNRNVSTFIGKAASDEFPKYKLKGYDVVNILGIRRLYITVFSKKNNLVKLSYDISYLSAKEVRDLQLSLNKIVKNNENSSENLPSDE